MDYQAVLNQRLIRRPPGRFDAESRLRHFAMITYALPAERLHPHIPRDRFTIPTFMINGKPSALISAVPFLDVDFHFSRFFPWLKFCFPQTNHRAYVIDNHTGQHGVWFFGTSLGSRFVAVPQQLWKLPWHFADYQFRCHFDPRLKRYETYQYTITSDWCAAEIDIRDTGQPVEISEGFATFEEMFLILTHPITGYFYRRDGRIGTYSIWHEPLQMTIGKPRALYFSLYERLRLLSKAEMQQPYSIMMCPETYFHIHLPPTAYEGQLLKG